MVYIKTWYHRNYHTARLAADSSLGRASETATDSAGTGLRRMETDGDGDRDGDGTAFGWIRRQSSS
ncbi:hypothetical protein AUR65_017055 [Haloferax marisrubri]|uniref:Uncharacterized protein n=1 Tax=Haloferax marisrubri TaxID=1544719 RepID=A0A2P4NMG9_9EURY|nr:hypothetical protein AUR65_017055 [Haloferax marisrubri]